MRRFTHTLIACLAATLAFSAQAATKIIVGTVPNTSDGPIICAIEKGYFKEQDIEVELTSFRTASDMTPMVVRGDIPIMGGGVSVSYFNGVAQGMPLRYFLSRAQIRSHHKIILRKGLAEKVKTIADLKGLRIATTAAGGFSEYELGKALETAGLTLDDVDTKPLAMPQTLTAMINGAIDAAVLIPPFDGGALRDGATMLVRLDQIVKPEMEVAGLIYNTEWAAKNRDLLDRFTAAYIKGARYFQQGVENGPNRDEIIDYFLKYAPIKNRAIFADTSWSDVNPDGKVVVASLLDQQDFYIRRGYLKTKMPIEKLVDEETAVRALKLLQSQGQ
ncbi:MULTISPECIES: ABC transporter substrate-binding protein [unclassified Beijerinckia]|uniref:ABC transporter substrate-binding protein n=1 Tax=unclassified Beijerinckia TaxID=2638183 RepID=UPI0008966DB3|nr:MULTISPECIES: ABC transporter substrate-binding protein [unclassified Beijerinckia]MDH7796176.1 NitT/TauT family transport system substrate-binding protein [Beijerinckia sp. GAS462]SEC33646.1 NitT/TauT family transport system substrate-binding protein [Beijerinckia sp. 28-YEA-48]